MRSNGQAFKAGTQEGKTLFAGMRGSRVPDSKTSGNGFLIS
jgi:hypothetical protein